MMTIIAERINMTRKAIREKVWQRDEAFIVNEVKTQEAAGATHIDVNAGWLHLWGAAGGKQDCDS